jgi:hypothetical protein
MDERCDAVPGLGDASPHSKRGCHGWANIVDGAQPEACPVPRPAGHFYYISKLFSIFSKYKTKSNKERNLEECRNAKNFRVPSWKRIFREYSA